MELLIHPPDNEFFSKKFDSLRCEQETQAYIINIFSKYMKTSQDDYSAKSLTLLYSKARDEHNFVIYQNLGDWIFFSKTMFPESLTAATDDYYQTIARNSYYSCFRLINKKWRVFEELSDNFCYLENQIKLHLKQKG